MIYVFGLNYSNLEDSKFSKNGGIGIFGDLIQHIEIRLNTWRFYLLYVWSEAEINYYWIR